MYYIYICKKFIYLSWILQIRSCQLRMKIFLLRLEPRFASQWFFFHAMSMKQWGSCIVLAPTSILHRLKVSSVVAFLYFFFSKMILIESSSDIGLKYRKSHLCSHALWKCIPLLLQMHNFNKWKKKLQSNKDYTILLHIIVIPNNEISLLHPTMK